MKADKADLAFAKHILPIFQKHYPEKVSRVYIFPKNTFLSMVFKVFSMLLRPETIKRIVLRSGPECLVEGLSRENILKRFGGTLESPFVAKDEGNATSPIATEESEVTVLDGLETGSGTVALVALVASPATNAKAETHIFSDDDEEEMDAFEDADAEFEHELEEATDLGQSVNRSKTSSALPPLPSADCAMVIEEVWSAPQDISE
jgi:hypothetical protein